MLKYCPRWKIEIEETSEVMCPACIFWKKVILKSGKEKMKCIFNNFKPGLKKGREWNV